MMVTIAEAARGITNEIERLAAEIGRRAIAEWIRSTAHGPNAFRDIVTRNASAVLADYLVARIMREGTMGDPATGEDYDALAMANTRISGHGVRETRIHLPCPFCAAPEFMSYLVIDAEAAMTAGATCEACGRSAKTIFTKHDDGGKSFEIVQTGGSDPPAYLPPMRRES